MHVELCLVLVHDDKSQSESCKGITNKFKHCGKHIEMNVLDDLLFLFGRI